MRVGIYARVSTEAQEARGTIGSQLEALRARVGAEGDELVAEFVDDGHSGARLDRPGLDALRDAAEAGVVEAVWCLSPDRLARAYAYQVLILDELARHQVPVRFTDAPPLDDPQARLLVQVQGVIAEYEKAKFAERERRGKLFRARAGEVLSRKVPYGYRRVPRSPDGPAHVIVHEPEAAVVRRIFAEFTGGTSVRRIALRLGDDHIASPEGKAIWPLATLFRLLRNEAYVGRLYWNRTANDRDPTTGRVRQTRRDRSEWVEIPVAGPNGAAVSLFPVTRCRRQSDDGDSGGRRGREPAGLANPAQYVRRPKVHPSDARGLERHGCRRRHPGRTWRDFVASKSSTDHDAAARVARIEAWALLHPRPDKPAPPEALRVADEIRELAMEFSAKCAELRAAMNR